MTPTVVYADADDNVASVSSRIHDNASGTVAVVIPEDNHHFERPLTLRLLRRHAATLGLELAIITTHPVVRGVVAEEGIPCFGSEAEFLRHQQRQEVPVNRFQEVLAEAPEWFRSLGRLSFAALVLIIAMSAAVVFLPVATVTVQPVTDVISGSVEITADPGARIPNPATRTLPARTVYLLIESVEQLDIAAKLTNGEAKARGVVTFTNRTEKEVPIPAGTVIRTGEGVAFETIEDAVAAGTLGASVRVRVSAVESGAAGNVPRLAISKIDGDLQHSLTVLNEERLVGGGSVSQTVVSTEDHEQLRRQVDQKGRDVARSRLMAQLGPNEILIPDSLSYTTINTEFDHGLGEEARVLTARATGRASGTIINAEELKFMAQELFKPPLREGFVLPPERIHVGTPQVSKAEETVLHLAVPVEGVSHARLNVDRIREYVRWRSVPEASRLLLADFPLATPPEVDVAPDWLGRAYRVDVIVEPANERAASD